MTTISPPHTRTSVLLDKKYWEFFVPTILMAMTLTMSIVVDSIIVGNLLGADALAAVNLVMPVAMAYNTLAVCLGLGVATLISVAKGRRQNDYANTIFSTALSVSVFVGVLFLIGQAVGLNQIISLLTSEPTLQPLVKSYLHVLLYGTPLIITIPGLAYCLRVDAHVKLASTILIVANLVNLGLDLLYMGPLKLGIAGSSLATVSGYAVGSLLLLPYIFSSQRTLRFSMGTLAPLRTLLRNLRDILKTGLPAAMGSILITIKILCINHIVLAVAGKSGMVAFSVCLSCLSFVSMFISGAAQAMTPITGVLYGEVDYQGIRFVVVRAMKTLLLASLATTLLLELAPELILELFGVRHAADLALGVPAIRIFSLSLIGTSISFLAMYYYMTIGRTRLSTAISFVQGFSVVPFALLLSHVAGMAGVWGAFSLAEIATILMVAVCYILLQRKSPQKYDSPLLLDRNQLPEGEKLELTCTNSDQGMETTMQQLTAFLESLDMDEQTADKLQATIETAVTTIFSKAHAPNKTAHVDIRVNVAPEATVVTLRDGGQEFTLESQHIAADSIDHSKAIGFNNHTITITPA